MLLARRRIIKTCRRNILYTCGLLEKLYNLKIQDTITLDNGKSYAGTDVLVNGETFKIGLCNSDYHYHILTIDEIMIIEMLLSWNALLESNSEESNMITFDDIDWMRDRKCRNKEYILANHRSYLDTMKRLSDLYLIYGDETKLNNDKPELCKLLNVDYIYDKEEIVGFRFSFGYLEQVLKTLNQRISLDMNIFAYSSKEFMKYQILRYIVISIYMCRVKCDTFCRTHKSILSAITYSDDNTCSYYDYMMNSKYINKYLKRYVDRLDEVMNCLKQCRLVKQYQIIADKNKRGLMTASGKIIITAYSNRRRHCINRVKKH